ncbi:MAG: hypothetical protein ITG01_11825 [Comamonas sp.]|nr:hypothetical protein [Comamonas sp.]
MERKEVLGLVVQATDAAMETVHNDIMELNARLSAQNFLLETLYANAFLSDPDGLKSLMQSAIEATRHNSTRSTAMSDEYAIEIQARIATRLGMFQTSVLRRIEGVGS